MALRTMSKEASWTSLVQEWTARNTVHRSALQGQFRDGKTGGWVSASEPLGLFWGGSETSWSHRLDEQPGKTGWLRVTSKCLAGATVQAAVQEPGRESLWVRRRRREGNRPDLRPPLPVPPTFSGPV